MDKEKRSSWGLNAVVAPATWSVLGVAGRGPLWAEGSSPPARLRGQAVDELPAIGEERVSTRDCIRGHAQPVLHLCCTPAQTRTVNFSTIHIMPDHNNSQIITTRDLNLIVPHQHCCCIVKGNFTTFYRVCTLRVKKNSMIFLRIEISLQQIKTKFV